MTSNAANPETRERCAVSLTRRPPQKPRPIWPAVIAGWFGAEDEVRQVGTHSESGIAEGHGVDELFQVTRAVYEN